MSTIYLNIGSNKGDRQALIEQAVAFITLQFPQATLRRSDFIETAPWGFDSDNKFLNLGIALDFPTSGNSNDIDKYHAINESAVVVPNDERKKIVTEADLKQLLDFHGKIQRIEQAVSSCHHRDANGNYIDREIDIDIIAIDDLIINTPTLIIPHPRMHLRDFVLTPMLQLAPTWRHPIMVTTIQELADTLNKQ